MSARSPLLTLALIACAPEEHDLDYGAYAPFDEARIATGAAHLAAHAVIATKRNEATLDNHDVIYGEMIDAYEVGGPQGDVFDLEDAHLDTVGYGLADAGVFLEREITDALAAGRAATIQEDLDWAGQIADKGLLVYFALATYAGLAARDRAGIDDAYAITGLALDGTPTAGLATVASGREAEFGVTLVRPQYEAFIEAAHLLEHGTDDDSDTLADDAEFDAAVEAIDGTLNQTLGLYVVHELDELTIENADVKLLEARVAWDGIAAWAEEVAPTEAAAVWAGLYPAGVPTRDLAGFYRNELASVRDGTTTVDVAGIRAALITILAAE